MNRNVLIIIIIVGLVLVAAAGTLVGIKLMNRGAATTDNITADQFAKSGTIILDKWANHEDEAIAIVKKFPVLSPEYIDAYAKAIEAGSSTADLTPATTSIERLVDAQFLEKSFNMSYLKKGEWRAIHLDTDAGMGAEQIPDPYYEVYLDFHDESVVVGPVWIVDLETKLVLPRNDMASIFDRNLQNYKEVNEKKERPGNVIRAIVSHKFDNGIDLGGVFLLHFLQMANKPKHENDRIIGWTVMQEFENDYSAYFQWIQLDEVRVAKFKFDWETKTLSPRGLQAIDLMTLGENMDTLRAADIYPSGYNKEHPKRIERWEKKDHPCRGKDVSTQRLCNAFITVLEQQEFISAMEWLLTGGKPNGARAIDECKEERKCSWSFKLADGEDVNPTKDDNLFEVDYKYELNNRPSVVRFLVNSKDESIKPLDKISQWAYWSVAPRTEM